MSADLRLNTRAKVLIAAGLASIVLLLTGHFAATATSDSYSAASRARMDSLRGKLGLGSDGMALGWSGGRTAAQTNAQEWAALEATNTTKANAAFAFLARNSDVWDVVQAMQSLLDRCPLCKQYEWVFLSDTPFDDTFKRATSAVSIAPCKYGLVEKKDWEEPSWIDEEKAAAARKKMVEDQVIYGGSVSYRRMCRYQSGGFFRHPLMAQYEYYWRIDPAVKFDCNIPYDPFLFMQTNKKKYGFTVSLYEYEATIPTLWQTTREFIDANPQYLAKPNAMNWVSNDGGKTYNRCHFWSNFEIGSLDFLRSEAYMKFFEHLDKSGGFSYERWGDAPVHSIAAALFLKPEEIHYFRDMGYFHNPFLTCPPEDLPNRSTCTCNPRHENNFYDHWYSCSNKWRELYPNA